MGYLIEFLPVVLMAATIVCIPLLATEMPGREKRAARRKAGLRVSRGATVPYVSARQQHRDQ